MNKKIFFSLIILFFFFLGILFAPVLSGFLQNKIMPIFSFNSAKPVVQVKPKEIVGKKIELSALELDKINKDFPDTVSGVISLLDSGSKIKTKDGKEYSLWPLQPISIYKYMGLANGQSVEIQGKILDANRLQWRLIK